LLDVDRLAKEIYCTDTEILGELRSSFGDSIFCPDGTLDYKILAQKVFSSKKELEKLNNLMFCRIEQKLNSLVNKNKERKCVIIDAAILFNTNLYKLCDYIIWVRADENKRGQYLRKKQSLSDYEVAMRLKGQHIKIRKKYVNFIINNYGSKRNLQEQVERFVQKIKI